MSCTLFARHALLPGGWADNVLLVWDGHGILSRVSAGETCPQGALHADGPVIPGLPNLHSHAFQRAFAGLTEYRAQVQENFWSWRTLMYRFAQRITPQQMYDIAIWLYIEMLEAGYTQVCEFHYVHHDTDGRPYADDATLSACLLRAARDSGLRITLLPVLYQDSDFGGKPPAEDQRRFIRRTDNLLDLLARLQPLCQAQGARLGLAPHSLRAVGPASLRAALAGLEAMDATAPVHIHIAEQTAEVSACLAWSGQRPVQWLLEHVDVNARWCLVHATHMNGDECRQAAQRGAVVGLCPSTEANLGDGLFDLSRWSAHAGRWGLGSDSHVTVDAAGEMRLLEYGQRLQRRERNVLATPDQPQVATHMLLEAVQGGVQAAGRMVPGDVAGLVAGQPADFVVLNAQDVALESLSAPDMLSSHVFASPRTQTIQSVWTLGAQRTQAAGRHPMHEAAARAFVRARHSLISVL